MKPLILITNDDGVQSKGIQELIDMACTLGNVVVMAPDGPRSAQSNALTMAVPVYYQLERKEPGLEIYKCSGTPTDCVKLALNNLLDRKPDLIFSGINHGSNSGINVIYSGTMGAVFEGCVNGIPSVGFSLCDHAKDADFSKAKIYFEQIAHKVMMEGLPSGVCLNVNAPKGDINGIRVTQQTKGYWTEEFENRTSPHGQDYYWLTGYFFNQEPDNQLTDEWALSQDYVAIVPTRIDMTDYDAIQLLKDYEEIR
ncbi:MAG TPA: 5'/3'-nucleotidase SurE [Paludibacteraceae bacterium]|nr:5'/3'-nucleotidase SurE [Paludibacteraceae bacterium]